MRSPLFATLAALRRAASTAPSPPPAPAPPHAVAAAAPPPRLRPCPAACLLAVNVYVSEGRDPAVLARLRAAAGGDAGDARAARAALVHTFVDAPYNRTGLTLAGRPSAGLAAAVLDVCGVALDAIDWGGGAAAVAAATHPALGAVDHVAVHPLFPAAPGADAAAAALAAEVGAGLGGAGVPVYTYGLAHGAGRTLAETRRALGYFGGGGEGGGSAGGGATAAAADGAGPPASRPRPDYGPAALPPRSGVAVVGATPWVVNVNVPLATADVGVAKAVARAVSSRGGGPLPAVEALGLPHGPDGTEVACNVRDPARVSVAALEDAIVAAAKLAGVEAAGRAYVTGRDPARVAADAARVLGYEIVH